MKIDVVYIKKCWFCWFMLLMENFQIYCLFLSQVNTPISLRYPCVIFFLIISKNNCLRLCKAVSREEDPPITVDIISNQQFLCGGGIGITCDMDEYQMKYLEFCCML